MYPIYQSNPVHRNGRRGHTQWAALVSETKEENMFRSGLSAGWESDSSIFSFLIKHDLVLCFLDRDSRLNFARFIGGKNWHGFPADVKLNSRDLPSYEILSSWESRGITTRAKIAKLRRRQLCAI